MHVLIVYCHPEPKSFNGALKDLALETLKCEGHTVEVSDLYKQEFDAAERGEHYIQRKNPNWFSGMDEQRYASNTSTLPSDVQIEIKRLERADLVIFQFPLWWHAQPALLKGYFDRVFVSGKLYTSTMRYDRGYFTGKRAICSITTGAPEGTFKGNGRGGNLEIMLWPIHYSIYYMGFTVLPAFVAHGIYPGRPGISGFASSADDCGYEQHLENQKSTWSHRLRQLDQLEPIKFPGWVDWDNSGHSISTK